MDQLAEMHHGIVGFDDGVTRVSRRVIEICRINAEGKLGLLVKIIGQSLEDHRGKSRACASADGVKDHEALHRVAALCNLSDTLERFINKFIVIAFTECESVCLVRQKLLGVEELLKWARLYPVNWASMLELQPIRV